mgnify:CR=1 FL=1
MMLNSETNHSDFDKLQSQFSAQYAAIFDNRLTPKTIVVIPSLTLDHEILSKVKGHFYYEERMLCMLMLLRMPETRITFVTSIPISPLIIDYYLHMLPGITPHHARNRLTLLSTYDSSNVPLTKKILNRPRLIQRIINSVPDAKAAHLVFFNTTDAERDLALKLNIPMYSCDPKLNYLGSKSGSRVIFKESGIDLPDGIEHLNTLDDIVHALVSLKCANRKITKAVVKMNEGFSGDGNAIFTYPDLHFTDEDLITYLKSNIESHLKIVAKKLSLKHFLQKFEAMGGIVEAFVEGTHIQSPSVQCRINPLGEICVISTHDQVLGGESSQVFVGANFPADAEYAVELSNISYKIAARLRDKGVLGRFGVDFMSVKIDNGWKHYAIEINLRKGGTTHPFLMLQFLTDGHYDPSTGKYKTQDGRDRYYFATDNLKNERYKGLTPLDLIDIAMYHGLHYDHSKVEGVMFHLISALSQYGKLGLVSIADSPTKAIANYEKVIEVLNAET